MEVASVAQYFPTLSIVNSIQEHESTIRKVSYIILIVLYVIVIIGYIYSLPGSTIKIKWKRSYRKFRKNTKTLWPMLQDTATHKRNSAFREHLVNN
ncbi:hypothetical protein GWI33_008580 [Rhynchophorus ferrugineus]|uniref:Uncharacterized protein n=1 Tax=Rhynchophorus ferrugineus TaxID=354439 RepID=A0A834IGF1_RHYFE|nr:hypothetical protein GWI33_008580 [Rhynchophorus ferrugineus]